MSFGQECYCPVALFSLLLLPRRVVSSPRDQHFCCLCFWAYLRSPSCLLCSCFSCIREQLWPVVGLFHCISTSGVSFHSLQSTTMELWSPEWPMQSAQSYRARSFCFAGVNKNAKLKANPPMPSTNGVTCLTFWNTLSQLTFHDKLIVLACHVGVYYFAMIHIFVVINGFIIKEEKNNF